MKQLLTLLLALLIAAPAMAQDDGEYSFLTEIVAEGDDTTGSGLTIQPALRLYVDGGTANYIEAYLGTRAVPGAIQSALSIGGIMKIVQVTGISTNDSFQLGSTTSVAALVSLTTVERDALTLASGEKAIIWNSTTAQAEVYNGTVWSALGAGGIVPLAEGGIGFDASALVKGDLIVGTGSAVASLLTTSGASVGDVLTLGATGDPGWVTPSLASEVDPTLTNDGTVIVGSGANDPAQITFDADGGTDGVLGYSGANDWFTLSRALAFQSGTQNYLYTSRSTNMAIHGQTAATASNWEYFSSDGDGTDDVGLWVYGLGTPAGVTNAEYFIWRWNAATGDYEFTSQADGTGTLRELSMYVEGFADQLVLETDGDVRMAAGTLTLGQNGTDGAFAIYSEQGATDYTITFVPNAAHTASQTYTLPAADGTVGQVLETDGSGNLSWGNDAGAGSFNLVDDLTPQLGGNLDMNAFSFFDGAREWVVGSYNASAVNHVQIANAATGSGPTISSVGDDANIDLSLTPKGTGALVLDGISWPTADGTSTQRLTTNGANQLVWASAGAIGVQDDIDFNEQATPPLTPAAGDVTLYFNNANPPELRLVDDTGTDAAVGGAALTVREQDASPSVSSVTEIRVNNASVTDETGGVVSIQTGWSRQRSTRGILFELTDVNDTNPTMLCGTVSGTTVPYTSPALEDVLTDLDATATVGYTIVKNLTLGTSAFVAPGGWNTAGNSFVVTNAADVSAWVSGNSLSLDADTDGRSNTGLSIDLTADIASEGMTGATHVQLLIRILDNDTANTWAGVPAMFVYDAVDNNRFAHTGIRDWHDSSATMSIAVIDEFLVWKLTATDVVTIHGDSRVPLSGEFYAYVVGYENRGE